MNNFNNKINKIYSFYPELVSYILILKNQSQNCTIIKKRETKVQKTKRNNNLTINNISKNKIKKDCCLFKKNRKKLNEKLQQLKMNLKGEVAVSMKIILEADLFLHQIIAMNLKDKLYIYVRVNILLIRAIIILKIILFLMIKTLKLKSGLILIHYHFNRIKISPLIYLFLIKKKKRYKIMMMFHNKVVFKIFYLEYLKINSQIKINILLI